MNMTIVKMNKLKHNWKKDMYGGHKVFIDVMSRDDFITMRANEVLHQLILFSIAGEVHGTLSKMPPSS
jgi:hypothetical protein